MNEPLLQVAPGFGETHEVHACGSGGEPQVVGGDTSVGDAFALVAVSHAMERSATGRCCRSTAWAAGWAARAKSALSPKTAALGRPAAVLALAAAGLAVASCVVLLAWVSLPLVLGRDQDTAEFAAGLSGLAAAAGLTATTLLVGLTGWYVQLTGRLVRASGPDVSISWELAWADPRYDDVVLRADIDALRHGPPNPRFSEWYVAVMLTNAGSQEVRVVGASVQASDAVLFRYTGSRISPDPLPLWLPGHDALTLYFPASDIEGLVEMVKASQDTKLMHGGIDASARLGNGCSLATPAVPIARFDI